VLAALSGKESRRGEAVLFFTPLTTKGKLQPASTEKNDKT
jgi:hypothetical protein